MYVFLWNYVKAFSKNIPIFSHLLFRIAKKIVMTSTRLNPEGSKGTIQIILNAHWCLILLILILLVCYKAEIQGFFLLFNTNFWNPEILTCQEPLNRCKSLFVTHSFSFLLEFPIYWKYVFLILVWSDTVLSREALVKDGSDCLLVLCLYPSIIFMCFHMFWKMGISSSIQTLSVKGRLCCQKSFRSTFLCHPVKRRMHLQLRLLMCLVERVNPVGNGDFISNSTQIVRLSNTVEVLPPVIGQWNP